MRLLKDREVPMPGIFKDFSCLYSLEIDTLISKGPAQS